MQMPNLALVKHKRAGTRFSAAAALSTASVVTFQNDTSISKELGVCLVSTFSYNISNMPLIPTSLLPSWILSPTPCFFSTPSSL